MKHKAVSAQSQYNIMTHTPVPKLILKLSIPSIISTLITNVYNLVDTAFVGDLGTSASGAVGVVFGFMAIIFFKKIPKNDEPDRVEKTGGQDEKA